MVGKPSDFLVAGDRAADFSNALQRRFNRHLDYRQAFYWGNGIYVQPPSATLDPASQLVSRGRATSFALGNLAAGI